MEIKLVAYGIAREIIGHSEMKMKVVDKITIGEFKKSIVGQYPEFGRLRDLRFAINEDYQNDDFVLTTNDEVVVIPPVSGG
ncbi:MAG: MoaD/ThiS family protein [Cyclobacteriaceae bacterium]|nr:MoaD/ThiS family protein [Cyclobacteriaceae bacterium]